MVPSQQEQLTFIQCLRGIAALVVAFSHFTLVQGVLFKDYQTFIPVLIGVWGVDIFFVISGFIMAYITANSTGGSSMAWLFFKRRLIRIVPAYWFFTAVIISLSLLFPAIAAHISITVSEVIKSLLLVPKSGFPVLIVGWTLVYEMYFYAIFALVLCFGVAHKHTIILLYLVFTGGLGLLITFTPVVLYTYFNPLILEFAFGLFAAHLFLSGKLLSKLLAWLVLICSWLVIIISTIVVDNNQLISNRYWLWGLPAFGIVYSLCSIPMVNSSNISRLFIWLGDISYSLYLCHAPVILLVFLVVPLLPVPPAYYTTLLVILSLPLSLLVSHISFKYLELKLSSQLKQWFTAKAP